MLDVVGISWPGGSPENTGFIVALIVGAYLLMLWLSAVVWTARDIHLRTPDPFAKLIATAIVLVFNFPGLVIYWVLRPPRTLQEAEEHRLESSALMRELQQTPPCPRCGYEIAEEYLACPKCALRLRLSCEACERVLEPGWQVCPWCMTAIPTARPQSTEPPTVPTSVNGGSDPTSEPREQQPTVVPSTPPMSATRTRVQHVQSSGVSTID